MDDRNKDALYPGPTGIEDSKRSTSCPAKSGSRFWRIAFLVGCTVGALLSADLLRLHINVHTDPGYHSYCAVSEYVDCESVAMSQYAVFGGLPVALWGLLAYLFLGGLCIWGLRDDLQPATWPFGLLFGLSAALVAVSLALFFISHWIIGSLCIVCTATYIVNGALCGLSLGELRRRRSGLLSALQSDLRQLTFKRKPVIIYTGFFLTVAAVLWIFLPAYWVTEASTGPGGLPVGHTEEGAHWIGARRPVIEIEEFSDYQCPYCLRGHAEVRSLVETYPDKIRLIHRHYPLRMHPEAYNYALMAHCAGKQNRFWEANDYLFAHGRRKNPVTVDELAAELGIAAGELAACIAEESTRQAVAQDVGRGRAFRIRGTPTFVIGNKNYPGRIPEKVLAPLLTSESLSDK